VGDCARWRHIPIVRPPKDVAVTSGLRDRGKKNYAQGFFINKPPATSPEEDEMKLMNGARAVGLALIAMALLAPATAQATETWWFDHEEGRYPIPFDEKSGTPKFFGFALTNEAKTVKFGPCENEGVGLAGELYSAYGGMGEGSFTEKSATLNKNCPTEGIEGGCEVKKMEPTGFPWQVTLTTSGTVVISSVSFTIELVGECKNSPIPKESKATGKLEGPFDNFKMEGEKKVQGKVTFNHAGELKVGEVKLFLDGYLQFGTEFTVKKEPTGFAPAYSPAKIEGTQLAPFKFTRSGKPSNAKRRKSKRQPKIATSRSQSRRPMATVKPR
jgi:hypothetical protein